MATFFFRSPGILYLEANDLVLRLLEVFDKFSSFKKVPYRTLGRSGYIPSGQHPWLNLDQMRSLLSIVSVMSCSSIPHDEPITSSGTNHPAPSFPKPKSLV
jgi:hypothetical protein